MAGSDVSVSTSVGRGSREMEGRIGTASDSGITHEHSEYVTAFAGGMLSSRCARNAKDLLRRANGAVEVEQRQCKSEEEFESAISNPTWTEVASLPSSSAEGPSSSCMSAAEIHASNQQFFQELIKKQVPPQRKDWVAAVNPKILDPPPFFRDFGGRLEVGKKLAQGGQAKIYEALFDGYSQASDGNFIYSEGFYMGPHVVKVFPIKHSEWFKRAWAKESASIYMRCTRLRDYDFTCCFVSNCTLLKDGRFAFLMRRYWGDLRKAIDVQVRKGNIPPFPLSISTGFIYQIALGMRTLHRNGMLHRDLKAANVLRIQKCLSQPAVYGNHPFCHVADFESADGVMGTKFWRAPEVLGVLRNSSEDKYSDPTVWTTKVDVYAYAMTCYEVLSGGLPFESRAPNDYNIGDERPALPGYVDQELQELLKKCWATEPSERPTFEFIMDELMRFSGRKIKYCKALAEDKRDDEAKEWLKWPFLYRDEIGAMRLLRFHAMNSGHKFDYM